MFLRRAVRAFLLSCEHQPASFADQLERDVVNIAVTDLVDEIHIFVVASFEPADNLRAITLWSNDCFLAGGPEVLHDHEIVRRRGTRGERTAFARHHATSNSVSASHRMAGTFISIRICTTPSAKSASDLSRAAEASAASAAAAAAAAAAA